MCYLPLSHIPISVPQENGYVSFVTMSSVDLYQAPLEGIQDLSHKGTSVLFSRKLDFLIDENFIWLAFESQRVSLDTVIWKAENILWFNANTHQGTWITYKRACGVHFKCQIWHNPVFPNIIKFCSHSFFSWYFPIPEIITMLMRYVEMT